MAETRRKSSRIEAPESSLAFAAGCATGAAAKISALAAWEKQLEFSVLKSDDLAKHRCNGSSLSVVLLGRRIYRFFRANTRSGIRRAPQTVS
jgi:hypothetical protein